MNGNSSPLEHLAASLICFALGVAATLSLALYGRCLKKQGKTPEGQR